MGVRFRTQPNQASARAEFFECASQQRRLKMFRTRHRVAVLFACVVAMGVAGRAYGQPAIVQLDYDAAKSLGQVAVAGGYIDVTQGAMIIPTASFGFIPDGTVPTYGAVGQPEYNALAVRDAVVQGQNFASGGYWNGQNGITSSTAATDPSHTTSV